MIDMNFDLDYIRKCSSMIKKFPVYTEAEKKQVAEGRTCIKLSKGQPIYPRNFKKRRDTFGGYIIVRYLFLYVDEPVPC